MARRAHGSSLTYVFPIFVHFDLLTFDVYRHHLPVATPGLNIPQSQHRYANSNQVAFYGLGLNNSIILGAIGYAKGNSMYRIFYNTAVGNLIIVCAGSIPGYWVTVALVDIVGRKPIQLMGFVLLTIIFAIIGFAYDKLLERNGALLALYVLAQFFFNFGMASFPPFPIFYSVLNRCTNTPHRTQRNNLHRPRRMFPNPLPQHLPRHLRRVRQSRCHNRANHFRAPASTNSSRLS